MREKIEQIVAAKELSEPNRRAIDGIFSNALDTMAQSYLMLEAISKGNVDVVGYVVTNHRAKFSEEDKDRFYKSIDTLGKTNTLAAAMMCMLFDNKEKADEYLIDPAITEGVAIYAAKHGYIKIVDYCYSKMTKDENYPLLHVIQAAAMAGQLQVLDYCLGDAQATYTLQTVKNCCFKAGMKDVHAALDWLYTKAPRMDWQELAKNAVESSNIEVLKWCSKREGISIGKLQAISQGETKEYLDQWMNLRRLGVAAVLVPALLAIASGASAPFLCTTFIAPIAGATVVAALAFGVGYKVMNDRFEEASRPAATLVIS